MRCFIAIKLPNEIKDYLFGLQKEIRSEYAKINFVHKKNLHLTLKFLGEINNKKIEVIKERLRKINFKHLKVSLNDIGFFPNEKSIRVVWISLKPINAVIELQQKIDSEILDLFNKDERFSNHLTLGRVKLIKNKEKFLERLRSLNIENKTFLINNFYLIKSDLKREGPEYIDLEVFELR